MAPWLRACVVSCKNKGLSSNPQSPLKKKKKKKYLFTRVSITLYTYNQNMPDTGTQWLAFATSRLSEKILSQKTKVESDGEQTPASSSGLCMHVHGRLHTGVCIHMGMCTRTRVCAHTHIHT